MSVDLAPDADSQLCAGACGPEPGSLLGEVASTHEAALHVVKVGSASLQQPAVLDEVAALRRRGTRVLVVAGGAAGVSQHYAAIGREERWLTLRNGDRVRDCSAAEMVHVEDAYRQVTLPLVRRELTTRGLTVLALPGTEVVTATAAPPLVVMEDGRRRIRRDHRVGTTAHVAVERLTTLLAAYDVVVVSPPVAADDGGGALNIDADMLAAHLTNELGAHHLRLVTGTPGLLADVDDPGSRVTDLVGQEGRQHARGRMRQKVRAAELVLEHGVADVAITGPHTLHAASGTRLWRDGPPDPRLELLARAVEIPSVTRDERELAEHLAAWCRDRGLDGTVDAAGNLVARRGEGARRLLLLGHLDTVPHLWRPRWDGDVLTGRGCVDAKGCLVNFLEVLPELEVPDGSEVVVVGAVEEEQSAVGAAFVRDHHRRADAVVIGEPSGVGAVTVGYFGLLKFSLRVSHALGHTAGRGVTTAADDLVDLLVSVRAAVSAVAPEALVATLGLHAVNAGDRQQGETVVDVRLPPGVDPTCVVAAVRDAVAPTGVRVHRATPGHAVRRSDPLVRSFTRALRAAGADPRYLAKKGSSDMNTLAVGWTGVPMVAYGPGDAALDHTPTEHLHGSEVLRARTVLAGAIREWLAAG